MRVTKLAVYHDEIRALYLGRAWGYKRIYQYLVAGGVACHPKSVAHYLRKWAGTFPTAKELGIHEYQISLGRVRIIREPKEKAKVFPVPKIVSHETGKQVGRGRAIIYPDTTRT